MSDSIKFDTQVVREYGRVSFGASLKENLADTFWQLDRDKPMSLADKLRWADKSQSATLFGPVGEAVAFVAGDVIWDGLNFLVMGLGKNLIIDTPVNAVRALAPPCTNGALPPRRTK